MTIFTIGSLLCALSWSVNVLIGFRILQAVGAAILAPLAPATTAMVFPPQQRGLGLALMAVVANGAAVLGPPIGGVLVELANWPWDAGWHWIFLINVPIGVLGIALALRVLPETYDPHAGTDVDWWGMVTLGASVFCLTFGLVEGNDRGWGSPLIVSLFVASVLLAGAFGGLISDLRVEHVEVVHEEAVAWTPIVFRRSETFGYWNNTPIEPTSAVSPAMMWSPPSAAM